jgi:hypothetical protein
MAILSLVGADMKHMIGIAGRTFSTLGEHNVNIEMISQGELARPFLLPLERHHLLLTYLCRSERDQYFVRGGSSGCYEGYECPPHSPVHLLGVGIKLGVGLTLYSDIVIVYGACIQLLCLHTCSTTEYKLHIDVYLWL